EYEALAEKAKLTGREVAQGFRVGRDLRLPGAAATQPAGEAGGVTAESGDQIIWGNSFDDIGPLAMVTATDFARLDEIRLSDYAKAGVSSALLDRMHADALRE